MKALTLTPPWCWLVPPKHIETRGRYSSHRGPLLIHAGKNLGPVGGWAGLIDMVRLEPFASLLWPRLQPHLRLHISTLDHFKAAPDSFIREALETLPMGQIISVCDVTACYPLCGEGYYRDPNRRVITRVSETERALGNYAPGRFGLLLDDIAPIAPGIPWRGWQGLFDVPDAALPAWVQARADERCNR